MSVEHVIPLPTATTKRPRRGSAEAFRAAIKNGSLVRLRPPRPPTSPLPDPTPLPPTGYLIAALIQALEVKAPGRRKVGDRVLDALSAMADDHREDREVWAGIHAAINMLCSRRTGRW